MAVLSWGKPKVEVCKIGTDGTLGEWKTLPEIVQNTAKLDTQAGEAVDAKAEGGGIVDSRSEKNTYTFEVELFIKKGDDEKEKQIEDTDG
ncbi:MAG: hypothetical protein LBU91_04235, partial [Bacteroidales bacterium]|nr:hypothetical protein [Bacteroidales bacterium]